MGGLVLVPDRVLHLRVLLLPALGQRRGVEGELQQVRALLRLEVELVLHLLQLRVLLVQQVQRVDEYLRLQHCTNISYFQLRRQLIHPHLQKA